MNSDKKENMSLEEELEQVRALFEETLKKETECAENPDSEQETASPDGEEKEEETQENDTPLCPRCGKKLSENILSEGGEYCEECRKAMLRRPLKKRGVFAIIMAVVVFFGSMITSMDSVMDFTDPASTEYEEFFNGYVAYKENKPVSAAAFYGSYLYKRQGSKNLSASALEQLIDAYCSMGEYPYAAQIIEDYYSDFALKLPQNGKYRKILEKNEVNGNTYNAIIAILQKNYAVGSYDYESIVKEIEALRNQTDSEGKALYSEYVIDIFAFDFSVPLEKDINLLLERMKEIDKKYGKQESDHLASLCRYASLCGDTATAEDCYNRMMKLNRQNMSIYSAYFNSIRFSENPDTGKMLEICHRMSEVSAELYKLGRYNFDYLYYYSIAYMLQGDAGEMPFTFMQQLYDSINIFGESYEGISRVTDIFNLYALAALYTGNTEVYEWAKKEVAYLGYELSDLVISYEKDLITAKEVLTDRKGDIA